MGALSSLSRESTITWWYFSLGSTFVFGAVFLWAWLTEEFATSEKWKGRKKILVTIAVIGVFGEQLSTLAEFAFSEHLQTIAEAKVARLEADTAEDERLMADRRINFVSVFVRTSKTPNPREGTYPEWANPTWFGLGPFSGIKLVVRCVPEFEAARFASDFIELDRTGQWGETRSELKIENDISKALEIRDGTHIYSWCPNFTDNWRRHMLDDPSKADPGKPEAMAFAAARTLLLMLKASSEIDADARCLGVFPNGQKPRFVDPPFDALPTDTVLIEIGAKDMTALFNRRMAHLESQVTFSATPSPTATPSATPTP